ncbi:MAG: SDR family NAD(P)-dependent oxidoreductase [Candidatus Eisenbacteria bacterium]|nr:SDR family NAD(P)-dependent oxidoreductase [Candidatus Eisenbacteria bacterium]MCC7140792.1 SDR family NAD(P)-dependent oxidoreductase [Candidatus Eisenbacteria bacterium]
MNRLDGCVALVTGASSGIGAATARALAAQGARLILAARRSDRLAALTAEIESVPGTTVLALSLDVRDREEVEAKLGTLPAAWQAIDLLVNNAGLSRGLDKLHEGSHADWEEMIDTNVKGLLYVTRSVVPGMVSRGRGHVVNVGSIAGHEVYPNGNVYCASKHAVDALTRGMRIDLNGTGVRVSTVDPGMVETEFSVVRFHGNTERAAGVYRGLTPLSADDVAEAIVWCASRPAHVNVAEIILFPTDQSSATVVHRR